ncbi:DALR anticodon-binding domain-containing protein 3 isoform X2 [Hetaerina americana]|uniref:DALR anticodon-binding domain-containing protein 3 isoform X2 n=1 Tax=Hetaerina americana TaxID=62018 RepID=UPI003A7F5AF1
MKRYMHCFIRESESWPMRIKECSLKNGKIVVKLDRTSVFKTILISLHSNGLKYGSQERRGEVISMSTDFIPEDSDLSQLRLALISKVLIRVLEKLGYTISTGPASAACCLKLHLTLNPAVKLSNVSTLVCGVVRNCSGLKKEVNISADMYRRMRGRDMEQASVHKYGSLVHQPPWEKFIAALSDAAVTVDLLSTKPSQPISLDLQDKFTLSREKSSKGATFLLYNYARLISILRQFEEKVREGVYPPLAPIESADFSLLSSEEEWALLYCYVMPFPSLLAQLVRPDLPTFNVHVLIQFMQDLCKCLSAYYSRVHILTEPRKHLLPLMYSRLHLISGIKILMQSIFALFNIIPVSQM